MQEHAMIGKDIPRTDGRAKATGAAIYTDDMKLPGMLYGKLLRSPLPHARIVRIDVKKALRLPGVKSVITGQDTPKVRYGNWRLFPVTQDEYPLALDKVRFIGDEVAAVAAVDRETAEEAISLITVDYEELPAVFDVEAAIKKGAPALHEASPGNISIDRKIRYGDIEKGFAESDYIREDVFTWSRVRLWPPATSTAASPCGPPPRPLISCNACWPPPWGCAKTTYG
jgi:CO/xanthine dehydrogenase Mo-binding subunit